MAKWNRAHDCYEVRIGREAEAFRPRSDTGPACYPSVTFL